jgi:AhpD family alkylhydroperoxidase
MVLRKMEKIAAKTAECGFESLDICKELAWFVEPADENTTVNEKAKQLLLVGLAWLHGCRFCAQQQMRAALEAGATQDEVAEVVLTTLAWTK